MTKRREHWDLALETAVAAVLVDVYENGYSDEQIRTVIAIVEDWQAAHARNIVYMVEPTSAEKAAIQRVREELEAWKGGSVATARILRALDGDA